MADPVLAARMQRLGARPGGLYVTDVADLRAEVEELNEPKRIFATLDLGQKNDYSAVSVLREQDGPWPRRLELVLLERVRGLPYDQVVDDFVALATETVTPLAKQYEAYHTAEMLIDVTGVGLGICDLVTRKGIPHWRVLIHGGVEVSRDGTTWKVPKREIAGALQVALQMQRLQIAAGLAHAETLIKEAEAFEMQISPAGHDSYNARSGAHDDLLLSVGMGVWYHSYQYARKPPRRAFTLI